MLEQLLTRLAEAIEANTAELKVITGTAKANLEKRGSVVATTPTEGSELAEPAKRRGRPPKETAAEPAPAPEPTPAPVKRPSEAKFKAMVEKYRDVDSDPVYDERMAFLKGLLKRLDPSKEKMAELDDEKFATAFNIIERAVAGEEIDLDAEFEPAARPARRRQDDDV